MNERRVEVGTDIWVPGTDWPDIMARCFISLSDRLQCQCRFLRLFLYPLTTC